MRTRGLGVVGRGCKWIQGVVPRPLTTFSNPMLGETFEDPRMKFIAEKVSHNPFIMAHHAEGEGWELWASSAGRTKFWGNTSFNRFNWLGRPAAHSWLREESRDYPPWHDTREDRR